VGPGDPELLTIKAYNLIREADVVFVPSPRKGGKSSAQSIAEGIMEDKDSVEFKELVFPMSRNDEVLEKRWKENAEIVLEACRKYLKVVFLTLGDPAIYSTFAYLMQEVRRLAPELPVVTVPGIPTLTLAVDLLNIPLITGEQKLVLTPLPQKTDSLRPLLSQFDTVVIYKIGERLKELKAVIKEEGLEDCCYFVSRAGMPGQYTARGLSNIDSGQVGYLSTMIVKPAEKRP